jgi:hypothetical protein
LFFLSSAGGVIGKKATVISNMQRETQTKVICVLPKVGGSLWLALVAIDELNHMHLVDRAITDLLENGT